jgi:hypothetical protein
MIRVELFLTFDIMLAGTCGGVRVAPASSTPTVIVIGAGFGGLAAARFLHNSNLKVQVSRLDLYPVFMIWCFEIAQTQHCDKDVLPSTLVHSFPSCQHLIKGILIG